VCPKSGQEQRSSYFDRCGQQRGQTHVMEGRIEMTRLVNAIEGKDDLAASAIKFGYGMVTLPIDCALS
jgi:hypothetical protein